MRFSLGLLSSTQGIETLREDEVTVATYIKSKLSPRDAVQFDKLHNDLKDGVQNNFTFLAFCFDHTYFIYIYSHLQMYKFLHQSCSFISHSRIV